MNLLDKYIPIDSSKTSNQYGISIEEFRQVQYNSIPKFIRLGIEYIKKISDDDFIIDSIEMERDIKYLDFGAYDLSTLKVKIKEQNSNEIIEYLSMKIPYLIDGSSYLLNGIQYIPCFYILDKPITIKKKSVKLYGLIHPISIYLMKKCIIFSGHNIPIKYVFALFFDRSIDIESKLIARICADYKVDDELVTESDLISYYKKLFPSANTKEDILNTFDMLFLDPYTKYLYQKCYGMKDDDISTKRIIIKSLIMLFDDDFVPNFIDLRNKRLVFAEMLLTPFFQRISIQTNKYLYKQHFRKFTFGIDEITKYFLSSSEKGGLRANYNYDIYNGYSGILTHYASMKNPCSETTPGEISSIHWTHKGRICPVTISPKNPGEKVSLVSGTRVDENGFFLNDDGSLL